MDQIVVAKLGCKFFQRQPALGYSGQGLYPLGKGLGQHPALPARRGGSHRLGLPRVNAREQVGVCVHRRGGGQTLITPVPQQTLGQMGGRQHVPALTDNLGLLLFPSPIQLHSVPHRGPRVQGVSSLLQHPGGGGDLSQVIKAGHVRGSEGQLHRLILAGFQQLCLLEGRQTALWLLEQAPGGGVVELNHLLARTVPSIGHPDGRLYFAVFRPGAHRLQSKAGVGQPVAKGIADLLRRPREGLKVPVAHIDVLGVLHIVGGVVEMLGGGVVGQIPGKGIGQLAARIGFSGEQRRNGRAPLHASLIGQQNRGDAIVLAEPGDIHHAAHVEYYRHLFKGGADLPYHAALFPGEIVVPLGENSLCSFGHIQLVGPGVVRLLVKHRFPVPSLPGETAEDDDGRVRLLSGGVHQFPGQLRLGHQAGNVASLIPSGHIVPVEVGQGRKEGELLLQGVMHISGIGSGHIPAAAAPLHIVKAALAKQGHSGIGSQRKQAPVVFQQHSPLLGGLPGQGDMLGACRHPAVPVQGQVGLIAGANPFFHKEILLVKKGAPPDLTALFSLFYSFTPPRVTPSTMNLDRSR